MKAIIIAQKCVNQTNEESVENQIECMKQYCDKNNLEIIKTMSFSNKPYIKQQEKINDIIGTIASQSDPIVICFQRENRLINKIFNSQAYQLVNMALDGKIELHFMTKRKTLNSSALNREAFSFTLGIFLEKTYVDRCQLEIGTNDTQEYNENNGQDELLA